MDEETQQEIDDAFCQLAIAQAVCDEADEDPDFAAWLDTILNRRITDAADRKRLGLAPLKGATVLDFKPS